MQAIPIILGALILAALIFAVGGMYRNRPSNMVPARRLQEALEALYDIERNTLDNVTVHGMTAEYNYILTRVGLVRQSINKEITK